MVEVFGVRVDNSWFSRPVLGTGKRCLTYQQIIVLIQWISPYSWRLFQSSLGFSMMLGYISTVFNRCIQLALPVDVSGFACHLELVSFGFSTMLPTTQLDKKAEFKTKWETAFSPLLNLDTAETGLITARGEWLQNDYDSEDRFFVGLLFWKSYAQASPRLLREANVLNVANHLERLVDDATEVMSAYTSQLNHISSDFVGLRPYDPFPDTVQSQTNHQLFKTPVKPKYTAIESTDPSGKDKFHLESMIQAREAPAQRIAVAPAGVWYPMGVISQHHLPPQPNSRFKANIEMISFFAQTGNERIATSFANLRKRLWQLGDCPQLVWGKNQSNEGGKDNILLFINRQNSCDANSADIADLKKSKHSEEETEAQIARSVQKFLNENGGNIQNLSRRSIVGPEQLDVLPNMEITTFDVLANDWRSFDYAYCNYTHTTYQQHVQRTMFTPWCAIQPVSRGWVPGKQAETAQFISVFRCDKEGAREEWYNDFAKRARTEYDLLGHIVDWLRTLSTSISVQYVVLEMEDPWMTADKSEKNNLEKEASRIAAEKLEEERRAQAVVPPSIFDLPWANILEKRRPT
ncbi:hypothetical protein N7540_011389 [Penicillium herquei]|nr:hypothetical protein N7540_011389 [Penicillium herquei]